MEGDDELQECWWTSNPVQEIKEAGSADSGEQTAMPPRSHPPVVESPVKLSYSLGTDGQAAQGASRWPREIAVQPWKETAILSPILHGKLPLDRPRPHTFPLTDHPATHP